MYGAFAAVERLAKVPDGQTCGVITEFGQRCCVVARKYFFCVRGHIGLSRHEFMPGAKKPLARKRLIGTVLRSERLTYCF